MILGRHRECSVIRSPSQEAMLRPKLGQVVIEGSPQATATMPHSLVDIVTSQGMWVDSLTQPLSQEVSGTRCNVLEAMLALLPGATMEAIMTKGMTGVVT